MEYMGYGNDDPDEAVKSGNAVRIQGPDVEWKKGNGDQMVNFVRVQNTKTGEVSNIITGEAEEGAEESYYDVKPFTLFNYDPLNPTFYLDNNGNNRKMFGLSIKLGYGENTSGLTNLDWIQTIERTNPEGVCERFVDPKGSEQEGHFPFYFTADQKKDPWWWPKDKYYSATFRDWPAVEGRNFSQSFEAELSLVGLNKKGKYVPIATLKYGFSLEPGDDKVRPYTPMIVKPSQYHLDVIRKAKKRD
jgi:hypothetical protein